MSYIPIILDLGSSEIKAGFSGQESPKLRSPNYIGELKNKKNYKDTQSFYTSDECDKFMGNLILHFPIEHGVFKNSDDIFPVFNYIYTKLEIGEEGIKDHPILISEPLHNQESNREKIAEILFEKMGVPSLIFGLQPLLSLFSTAYTTGVILESGDAITQSCVSYEGYLLPSSCFRYDYGGRDVTNVLGLLIDKNNYNFNFNNFTDMKIFKNIKEKQCYLKMYKEKPLSGDIDATNIDKDKEKKEEAKEEDNLDDQFRSVNSEFILPDGNKIQLGDEKILAPEILFNSKLNFSELPTFHEIVFNSIIKADINIKNKLYNTVVLSGGNTQFKGMEEKMKYNLEKLAPKHMKIKIRMNSNPQLSCWNGGNIISSLGSFRKMLVTKSDWDENGRNIIHEKCI